MDFLDSAVEKAKQVLDVAYKATDDAVTQGKQKIDEVTIEKSLAKDYQKLGSYYYELLKDSELDPEIITVFESIKEKKEKLEELRNE